jgi:hypothetical protein
VALGRIRRQFPLRGMGFFERFFSGETKVAQALEDVVSRRKLEGFNCPRRGAVKARRDCRP